METGQSQPTSSSIRRSAAKPIISLRRLRRQVAQPARVSAFRQQLAQGSLLAGHHDVLGSVLRVAPQPYPTQFTAVNSSYNTSWDTPLPGPDMPGKETLLGLRLRREMTQRSADPGGLFSPECLHDGVYSITPCDVWGEVSSCLAQRPCPCRSRPRPCPQRGRLSASRPRRRHGYIVTAL